MTAAAVIKERRAREYEVIFIMRANSDTKHAEKVLDRMREVIASLEGRLLEIENWGRRRLAYEIEKASRGVFVYVRFVGYENLVVELERNLRLLDEVLRFQTILLSPRVELAAYEVSDEHLAFGELDGEESSEEPSFAQRLGLAERPRPERSPEGPQGERPQAESPQGEGADAPSAGAPSAGAPSADAPSADAPSADAPSADTPSADAPSADAPSADAPSADAPSADAPSADAPSAAIEADQAAGEATGEGAEKEGAQ